jgi:uncharacterized protein YndB with AHSA1/START domain
MNKKIKSIFAGVAVLLAGILIYGAFKPGNFHVQRTIAINAPTERIFPLINDFHNWSQWSPYENLDPNMKRTFGGPASGQGSIYGWEGNSKAGKGQMEITESAPSSKVVIRLDFVKPIEGHDTVEFTLQPNGSSTNVTWAMAGPLNFSGKVMTIFVSMDSIMGGDFENGLAKMKAAAEKSKD